MNKVFGLQHKGSIGIVTDKNVYVAGELVTGRVYVDVREPIECNAIVMKATGKEETRFTVRRTRSNANGETEHYDEHYYGSHTFFKVKIILHQIMGGTILPGQYMYPIQYQLPPNLPGSANMWSGLRSGAHARILYKLKATVERCGVFSRDLKGKRELVIRGQSLEMYHASIVDLTKNVRFLCCFNKGLCKLRAEMDKNVYFPGEMANIIARVENESTVKISDMKCTLIQDICLRSNCGRTHHERRQLNKVKFPGVEPGGRLDQHQPIQLAGHHLYPTTQSRLIDCRYHILITCGICLCPDVKLELPVTILSPDVPYLGWVPAVPAQYQVPVGIPLTTTTTPMPTMTGPPPPPPVPIVDAMPLENSAIATTDKDNVSQKDGSYVEMVDATAPIEPSAPEKPLTSGV